MHFDDDDRFLGGEVIEDPVVIVQHNHWRDAVWHKAVRRDASPPKSTSVSNVREARAALAGLVYRGIGLRGGDPDQS